MHTPEVKAVLYALSRLYIYPELTDRECENIVSFFQSRVYCLDQDSIIDKYMDWMRALKNLASNYSSDTSYLLITPLFFIQDGKIK